MSETEHADLIRTADAWAQRRLADLGSSHPDSLKAAITQLKSGAGLVVCTVVAGGEYQIDLCLIGEDRRMRTLVSVSAGAPSEGGLN